MGYYGVCCVHETKTLLLTFHQLIISDAASRSLVQDWLLRTYLPPASYRMSLRRPILKYLSTSEPQPAAPSYRGGRVHFPPTPEISATYFAHSARTYDRSAIEVSPNVCTLPQRHCPDRTYVLSDREGEAHLLKTVEPGEMQDDDVTGDGIPGVEYDQSVTRMDYFSFPALSTTREMIECDGLLSSSKDANRGLQSVPMLAVSVHNTHAREASSPHDHTQGALAFLPPTLPLERKRSLSLRDLGRLDRPHSIASAESGNTSPVRSRRLRRASSFSNVPSDSGCLGGF